ncbi:MAG: IMP dehydrogenase [Thermaceae bacterium]|nr:IMP dehydrogenase [Thermaceae bacterium]
MNTEILDQISLEALEQAQTAIAAYPYPRLETYYTFADKSIIPTFLTKPFSRSQVGTRQLFYTLRASEEIFPAFGASMSMMRSRFARDVWDEGSGGVHILPRVGLSDAQRIADVQASAPAQVGVALGISEDETFLAELFAQPNLAFASIDIAHGANAAVLPVLAKIRQQGIESGIMLGNVGSLEGFAYAYWLMKLSGFKHFIIKVGVGPGSVCTTRINTGVGVGQLSLLEEIYRFRGGAGYTDAQIISDGGVNSAGDFVKAMAYSEGVMMGKFFASGSFEDEVLIKKDGRLEGIHLYGMASSLVTEKRNYIEGSSQTLRAFHHTAQEAVSRLREGLQSAMTYVNATNLNEFRGNVRFALNSAAAITEAGVH